jgi:DNA invertase Pin-like site-specific DNA recombinase
LQHSAALATRNTGDSTLRSTKLPSIHFQLGLNRLTVDASQRKFDAVLVWMLDRFGRSLRHLVNALAELEARRLTFISLRDNLDLTTPSGRLMSQIIGALSRV